AYGIARSIVGPIHALSRGALRIANGETDVVIDAPRSRDEVSILTRAFNVMSDRLRRNQVEIEKQRIEIEEANRQLVSQNEELARLSITDDLTKLYNYRFFQDHLPREVKRAKRTKQPFSLILIDIDDFKQLNDRYGHAVGDTVLRRIAVVMQGVVRETDFLARYGGEEFALLVSHTDVDGAGALAEKIRMAVAEERFPVPGGQKSAGVQVTVSIGVAAFRGDAKKLFNDADRELYQAKEAGKDCVRVAARR
ncbi:MAG: sensor domain-containing diguanylate cyclase, partial [Gammaproteobacteria bacterium]